jgi:hypothetical protein
MAKKNKDPKSLEGRLASTMKKAAKKAPKPQATAEDIEDVAKATAKRIADSYAMEIDQQDGKPPRLLDGKTEKSVEEDAAAEVAEDPREDEGEGEPAPWDQLRESVLWMGEHGEFLPRPELNTKIMGLVPLVKEIDKRAGIPSPLEDPDADVRPVARTLNALLNDLAAFREQVPRMAKRESALGFIDGIVGKVRELDAHTVAERGEWMRKVDGTAKDAPAPADAKTAETFRAEMKALEKEKDALDFRNTELEKRAEQLVADAEDLILWGLEAGAERAALGDAVEDPEVSELLRVHNLEKLADAKAMPKAAPANTAAQHVKPLPLSPEMERAPLGFTAPVCLDPPKCVACNGTGKATKGGPCGPCAGSGIKGAKVQGSLTVETVANGKVIARETVPNVVVSAPSALDEF